MIFLSDLLYSVWQSLGSTHVNSSKMLFALFTPIPHDWTRYVKFSKGYVICDVTNRLNKEEEFSYLY